MKKLLLFFHARSEKRGFFKFLVRLGCILMVLASFINNSFAQTKQWDKTIGSIEADGLYIVQQTPDNGYILGGYSESNKSGDKSENSKGLEDYWIVKLKANGTKEWDKTIGGSFSDRLNSLQQTPDGGYILGGRSNSGKSGDKSEAGRGFEDYWIVKLKADGSKEWDKTFGGSKDDYFEALELTRDGGYLLGGRSSSGKSGDKSEAKKGSEDYWVIKLKANGSKEWDKTFGGTQGNSLSALQQTKDDGYILGGSSGSGISGDKSQEARGWSDYWIIKLKPNGTKAWDKRFGGPQDDNLGSLHQTPDGGYILGGSSNSDAGGDKTENRKGTNPGGYWYNPDFWIVKLDANGNKIWDKTFGGQDAEFFGDLQLTREGGYILGGSSYSGVGFDKTQPSRGEADYWLIKIREDGTKIWDKAFGGNDQDYLSSLQQTLDGGYILGGSSFSDISGDKTQPVKNGIDFDFWVVKVADNPYCVPVSTNDCTIGIIINSFSFYTLVNNNSGCNGKKGSYINYTPSGNYTTSVKRGQSYPVSLQGGLDNDHYFGVWIDYNNDQDFDDPNEFVYQSTTSPNGTITGSISIPENVTEGIRRLRVRTQSDGDFSSNKSCSTIRSGETEDYTITINDKSNDSGRTAEWDQRYGGAANEGFLALIKTQDGGYLAGGYSSSNRSGDKSQPSQGENDYWIVKTDSEGKKLWDKTYGGAGNDYLNRLLETPDGGYLLAGSSVSGISGDKTQASRGGRDFWVVKTDARGNKQWDQVYGGSGYDELKKVVLLPTGEYLLAGYSNSPADGDKSQKARGGTDFWIVKITSRGAKIWDKRYGGNLNETLSGAISTPDGGFLLGGSSVSGYNGDKSSVSRGGNDFWLVRVDRNGNKLWDKTYGGVGEDQAYSLGKSSTSEYFISGQSDSPAGGEKTQGSQGGSDFWLIKISSNGTKLWDKRFGGSANEELRASIATQDGGFLLAGRSYSGVSGNKTQNSRGASDYWLVKVDTNGFYQWDQRFGGSAYEELRAVTQAPDGGYVLAGRSASGVSGDRTQPSQGGTDYWLVKVAPETKSLVATRAASATEAANPSKFTPFTAYPNPFQDRVTVEFTLAQTQAATLKVLDSQGRVIKTLFHQEATANQTYQVEWQAGKQPTGMYLLQLQTPSGQNTQKILLTK